MGAGDWIMATAQVKALYAKRKAPVIVVGRGNQVQWHEIFENNPKIVKVYRPGVQRLVNGSGVRPYISGKTAKNWVWHRWAIQPGEIFLSQAEKEFAQAFAGCIVIEPNTKVADSNKAWIWDRWQELADLGQANFVQVGPKGIKVLNGVAHVETPTFRHACAVLSVSHGFVGTEGGLHHAAAALGKKAVVLFSEFISPDITGYAMHKNLRHAGRACGSRIPCVSCKTSMEAISVDEVARALKEICDSTSRHLVT